MLKKEVKKIPNTRSGYIASVEVTENKKVYFLINKNKNDILAGVTVEKKENNFWFKFYLNKYILEKNLFSDKNLKYLKLFFRDFGKNWAKKDIILKCNYLFFDYIELHETNENNYIYITEYKNFKNCTSRETRNFFKNMFSEYGYREKRKSGAGYYGLYTSCKFGFSNYLFYEILEVLR